MSSDGARIKFLFYKGTIAGELVVVVVDPDTNDEDPVYMCSLNQIGQGQLADLISGGVPTDIALAYSGTSAADYQAFKTTGELPPFVEGASK